MAISGCNSSTGILSPRKRRMKLYHFSLEPRGALTSQLEQKHLNMLKCRLTDQSESIKIQTKPMSRWLGARLQNLEKRLPAFVISVRLYVRPYGTTRLLLDAFSWCLIFDYFSKICQKMQVPLKSEKQKERVLYTKACVRLW